MTRGPLALAVCLLACLACQGPVQDGSGGDATPSPSSSAGTNITVAGDAENHYPEVRVTRVDCASAGAPSASVSFLLPAEPPPSTIQGELLVSVTGSRATALNALYTLFVAPNQTAIGRAGRFDRLNLKATEVHGQDGRPVAAGSLTVTGTYACP